MKHNLVIYIIGRQTSIWHERLLQIKVTSHNDIPFTFIHYVNTGPYSQFYFEAVEG